MDEPVISTAANRPDLFRRASELTADLWPVYNTHGDVLSQYWAHFEEAFPQFQFTVHDGRINPGNDARGTRHCQCAAADCNSRAEP